MDLTYSDVFMVPNRLNVASRLDVDLTSTDGSATSLSLVAASMTAVSGRRMAETMARRGGLAVLPQDIPVEVVAQSTAEVKQSHSVFDIIVTVSPHTTVEGTIGLMAKRLYGVAVVVESGRVVGLIHPQDAATAGRLAQAYDVMTSNIITVSSGTAPKRVLDSLAECHRKVALAVDPEGLLAGIMTSKGALRSAPYTPALDEQGRLRTGVAIGINGDMTAKAWAVLEAQADALVMDTVHGHQEKMIAVLEPACGERDRFAERTGRRAPIAMGNVVTANGVRNLAGVGADIIKVGVRPGATCTTRMQTGVGRLQFPAALECLEQACRSGCMVWADGGVRHPRDVVLALAAGAGSVVIGSWFVGTHESTDDQLFGHERRAYEEGFGMVSACVIKQRTREQPTFNQVRAALFEEGTSSSRVYLGSQRPGVEDLLDWITPGTRSSATYVGARTFAEFNDRAVVGAQSGSGFEEGRPVSTNWQPGAEPSERSRRKRRRR